MTNIKDIRDRILRERGLTTTRSDVSKHRKITTAVAEVKVTKTPLMRLLEAIHKDNIVNILCSGSLSYIEKKYKIDRTTASKWRKRISLELLSSINN